MCLLSIRYIRYEVLWLILYELCFFYLWEIFFNIVCGKIEIMNSNIISNVFRVLGGILNICVCVIGYFVFWDELYYIRFSIMIKSNMYVYRFYVNFVNVMLL